MFYIVELRHNPSNRVWRLQKDRTWKEVTEEGLSSSDYATRELKRAEYYLRVPVKAFNGRVIEWMYIPSETPWQMEVWEYEGEME